MKTNKNILSLLFIASLSLQACDNGVEFGDPLFPETGNELSVKAYIDNHCFYPKNEMESNVVQTGDGSKLMVQDEEVKIKVQLTNAAATDLNFSLVVNNELAKNTAEGVTPLSEDAITFGTREVTIPQGELESTDELNFSLNKESKALKEFEKDGYITLQLVSTNDVEISEKYNSYTWKVSKEITNIDVSGKLEGKQAIGTDMMSVLNMYNMPETDVMDDDMETYGMYYIGSTKVPIVFNEAQEVIGLSFTPTGLWGAWSLSPRKAEILGGMEEDKQTRIGIATNTQPMPSDHTPWEIVFFSPIKVKYMTINFLENYDENSQNVIISEVKAYK